jgi:hypothetical protein
MESSTSDSSEDPPKHGADRPDNHVRWTGEHAVKRAMRALVAVEGISFLLAAMIHAGILIQGYAHREAMVAESVIGAVLLGGLMLTWIRPRSMFSIAAVVQAFALFWTLVGAWMIIIGIGPRTVPDIVYHVVIIGLLVVGIGVAWRARGTESI